MRPNSSLTALIKPSHESSTTVDTPDESGPLSPSSVFVALCTWDCSVMLLFAHSAEVVLWPVTIIVKAVLLYICSVVRDA